MLKHIFSSTQLDWPHSGTAFTAQYASLRITVGDTVQFSFTYTFVSSCFHSSENVLRRLFAPSFSHACRISPKQQQQMKKSASDQLTYHEQRGRDSCCHIGHIQLKLITVRKKPPFRNHLRVCSISTSLHHGDAYATPVWNIIVK